MAEQRPLVVQVRGMLDPVAVAVLVPRVGGTGEARGAVRHRIEHDVLVALLQPHRLRLVVHGPAVARGFGHGADIKATQRRAVAHVGVPRRGRIGRERECLIVHRGEAARERAAVAYTRTGRARREVQQPVAAPAVPVRPSLVAVIVARPAARPMTRPVVTDATLESLVAQVTARPASGVPCASSGTAVSWAVWPTRTTRDLGLTATAATGVACSAPGPEEQAATVIKSVPRSRRRRGAACCADRKS